jgi:lysophospholipase L1-like esterase
MKRFWSGLLLALLWIMGGAGSSAFAATAPPLRIMPLGDSITDGVGAPGGYRGTLYNLLTAQGYNVDMVGNQTDNSEGLIEKEHEGHPGWRIDQLDSNIEAWLAAIEDPDFVLVHIGTNDFGQGLDTTHAINRLDALILKIAMLRPNANIVVTNLMVRGEPYNTQIQQQFNPFVQGVVNAHAAAGRKVTFLDMRSAVPLSDMPDQLHPNATGYTKMANAWRGAIQALATPVGDHSAPKIARVAGKVSRTEVSVIFSKPVADAAATVGNFAIPGLTISGAVLDASQRVVTLTTSLQTPATTYTVTVNNVVDRQTAPLALAANSSATFVPALPRGYQHYAGESSQYTLVCSLDIPVAPLWRYAPPVYQVDNRAALGPFDRVAYYMELQGADGQLKYVWASMDAFTNDAGKIGVPTVASGAVFQQSVTNLNVISNVAGVVTGSGMQGNLEFWPSTYLPANAAGISGASDTNLDYGDQRTTSGDYGSMQLHNAAAHQTVFAFNNWGKGVFDTNADLGIGNDPAPVTGGVDWTYANNAAGFTIRTLQVLVRTGGDHTPPGVSAAMVAPSGTQVVVDFSEPLAAASVDVLDFTLDQGVSVVAAALSADHRRVTLTTTAQPTGTALTLGVTGVRDSSANANLIAAGTSVTVAAASLPAEVTANVGAAANGYQLVYSADLGVTGNFNSGNGYTFDDHLAASTISRVAYYLELQQQGAPTRYVWAAMDAFAGGRAHLGVPIPANGTVFQTNVANLQVISNMPGVTNGTTTAGGNIEFWPYNYNGGNAQSVPGASATNFDTGDTIDTGGNYGSMQIHNHAANQTVMAINHFGDDGNVLDIGIGNDPAPVTAGVDWTFAGTAGNYTRRILHVMVLPGVATAPAVIARVPEAANYQLAYSLNIPATGNLQSGAGFAPYALSDGGGTSSFSRVAYYMELQKTGDAASSYVWVSMDAFTKSGALTGVPTGAIFQQKVTNMNVFSNVAGIVNGTNLTTGNIEFWSGNYNQTNGLAIPGASNANYDWGDGGVSGGSGYGSMQVHNYGASQTLFALNNWGSVGNTTNKLCVGIGNDPSPVNGGVDWTFAENAATWNVKRTLQVYLLPALTDTTAPVLVRVNGSTTDDRISLTFDEAISQRAVVEAVVTIPGLTVTRLERMGTDTLVVHTSPQTPGTVYTVNVSGVKDRSPAGNVATVSGGFTAYAAPANFANVPEISGYRHVLSLALPTVAPQYNTKGVPYGIDETKYGEFSFDRVAYLMELDGRWVYASFDPLVTKLSQVGVPTGAAVSGPVQGLVAHMNVASNAAGIVTGTDLATGSIEFWSGNYDRGNGVGIPGASDSTYDFGDVMTLGTYGCMQIANYGASQTIMAFNDWSGNTDNTDLGIGNDPSPVNGGVDWTFSGSGPTYTKRNLYVLVRPSPGDADLATLYSQPGDKTVGEGGKVSFTVSVAGDVAYRYQWQHNGVDIPGATQPWLDLANASAADAGSYDVVITGPGGVATTSAAGSLAVTPGDNALPSKITRNADGTIGLVFYGTPGGSYLLQRSVTLGAGDWTTLQTATAGASTGEMDYTDLTPPSPKAFYRAVIAP